MKSESFKSTCSYCGVGCGVVISRDQKGAIKVTGDETHPVNQGMLCSKGMNLHYVVEDQSDRLLTPLMREGKGYGLKVVDWESAMRRAAAVFTSLIKKYGPNSVGFYVSGQCLTEEYYLINKLTKGFLRTNNIDTNSRLCMSSAVMGYQLTLGEDIVPTTYEDIELSDCIMVAGANPAWCHPILWRRVEKHKETNPNVKIIVVDPRRTQTCQLADLHLQLIPGTDVILYYAIGRCLIENQAVDREFIENHTDGFEKYLEKVMQTSLEVASQVCGIPIPAIQLAAKYIGEAKGFLTMWAMGLNQSADGVAKNLALIDLNLITGQIGKPGSGPFSLTGQPNAMGGREVGGMATMLSSHRKLADPKHRKEVADFWGVEDIAASPGLTATQMVDALESGEMKAIWIICTNPLVSLPDTNKVEKALKHAKFVVVQDISNKAEAIPYADLVLPAAGWSEKEGTMTNSERRVSYLRKVKEAPGEALPDAEIIIRFAKMMGFKGFDYGEMSEVFQEHCKLTKGTNIDVSGLSYAMLKERGTVQWPFTSTASKGTTRLFLDKKFFTANQRAQISVEENIATNEPLSEEFPLVLTTGRIRDQWHTMTRTGKVNKLKQHISKPYLEIHPLDAQARKLVENDTVMVIGGRGKVKLLVKITVDIRPGVVFLPMHWGRIFGSDFARTNNLTGNAIDPISKQPDFKYTAVQVSKFVKPKQRIVVVGAGAASYRFIQTYRELNDVDEITVFSKEEHPFYNRVLLPDYVSKHKTWAELQKLKVGELEQLNVKLFVKNGIEQIDAENKFVLDESGNQHPYDVLILATGSRAFVPADVPVYLPGIFTMRSKNHADDLVNYLNGKGHVVIIGGGLLGLELAASLREIDIQVTVIQLASRLMERQLDPVASALLKDKIEEMGVSLYLNNQVYKLEQANPQGLKVHLKSGAVLDCSAVVYAIGTRPNMELAKEIGLASGAGVKVNQHMKTSDPYIYALGEIAEYNQRLNGITAAAEQHAEVAARYINGDELSAYEGTVPMNILKFADLDLCSIGIPEVPANQEGYEEILLMDTSQRYYKKCIVYQDRLVGAILLGDKSEFSEFKSLIEDRIELSDKRKELLRGKSSHAAPIGKLVCTCGNVGQGNLEAAIQQGVQSLQEICQVTGAGLGCGSCKPEIKNLLLENSQLQTV
ncbi:molybdopterin-dependent oxidoreductase [Belliella sp. DSM 111904]|uniref:Molybdopterin-dependent oxidoreductase n=1 Tax=Belliella filtrata TaxID=2923435 RepID=A0ABS9UZD6_9BACT|nr:nitrate reductase [Belliella filtrata]MCH7409514.1 molybdopterin-dependent oxidoreductase [Belliella filtrata]